MASVKFNRDFTTREIPPRSFHKGEILSGLTDQSVWYWENTGFGERVPEAAPRRQPAAADTAHADDAPTEPATGAPERRPEPGPSPTVATERTGSAGGFAVPGPVGRGGRR